MLCNHYIFPLPPGKPTMQELLSFSAEKVNIVANMGIGYTMLGIFLLNDTEENIVTALEVEHNYNAERINFALLQ